MSFEQDKQLAIIGEFVVWNALTKMWLIGNGFQH